MKSPSKTLYFAKQYIKNHLLKLVSSFAVSVFIIRGSQEAVVRAKAMIMEKIATSDGPKEEKNLKRTCYFCGSKNHKIAECPNKANN